MNEIIYVKHREINREKWDDCIKNSSNALIYAHSWYLDVVSPGWDALIENDYTSVFPLAKNKKFGIQYLFPPYFSQQLGLFSKNIISKNKITLFLADVAKTFKYAEINLNWKNDFISSDFEIKKSITHHLDLNSSYQKIYNGYHDNLKRNLHKACGFLQAVSHKIDPNEIIALFKNNKGKEIKNLKEKYYTTLRKLVKAAEKNKAIIISGIKNENNNLIAGAFFFKDANTITFLFSGMNAEGRKKHSMPFIIDDVIKNNSEKKVMLDFEGSNIPNLARFYKSFGAREIVYLQIKRNNLPRILKWIKN